MSDHLISTRILRERKAAVEADIAAQKRLRSDADPFWRITAWVLAEWDAAVREAEREYVSTAEAVRLTGWNDATLRRYARLVLAGEGVPVPWNGLLVQRTDSGLAFCVSSIPAKGRAAA